MKGRPETFCVRCAHGFDGMHCRVNPPVVIARGSASEFDAASGKPRVTWTGFPLLPLDGLGCGQFDPSPRTVEATT